MKVGIIGLGTAGQQLIERLNNKPIDGCEITAVLVRDVSRYPAQKRPYLLTQNRDLFFAEGLDLVVETAGHQAVVEHGVESLRRGADFVVVSVGALGEADLYDALLAQARASNRRVILPSAAIAGLDRIAAAAEGDLQQVRLTTRKPVRAWRGTYAETVVDLDAVREPISIFEGNARESSRLFPESVNVSAALSLAGLGFERTEVRVVVDPTIERNIHEVSAVGEFGEVHIEVQNTPSPDNPKTGYIVAMSIAKVLRNLASPIQVGL
ncbi:aspartate dehydrogenase [Saccharospirillum sp. HFRX-1]|uniref:aspartate dehydrogenase n=1 Tax=unclassified Saccharospirillum TaxID=2633430 RepID=UPI0037192259